MTTGKLLLLTGAPDPSRLDWNPEDLLTTFDPSIARFAHLHPYAPPQDQDQDQAQDQGHQNKDISVLDLALWRSLPLVRAHIPTGWSQQHDLLLVGAFPGSADFLTTASLSSELEVAAASRGLTQEDEDEESSRLLAEFYEHSLAVHDDVASSQLVAAPGAGRADASFVSDTHSEAATASSPSSSSSSALSASSSTGEDDDDTTTTNFPPGPVSQPKTPLRPAGPGRRGRGVADHLSDLEDIPPAAYLLRAAPATVSVTLVAGVISIAAPRAVATRFGGHKTLVEVLVGDETKSGFGVTFWLGDDADDDADAADGGAGGVLRGLRGQDVVLMRNVALNVFRGKVYGGSLRRGMTRVFLLYRGGGEDGEDGGGGGYYSRADLLKAGRAGSGAAAVHPQLEKTRKVRDWVLKFVGAGTGAGGDGGGKKNKTGKNRKGKGGPPTQRQWNQPPPLDSQ